MNTTSARRGASSWYYPIDGGDFDELVHYLETFTDGNNAGWNLSDEFRDKLLSCDKDAVMRWGKMLSCKGNVGSGYQLFIDKVNRKVPQMYKDKGLKVKASNLCVAPDTVILTRDGNKVISEVVDTEVEVWNGEEWSNVEVVKTGSDRKVVKVHLSEFINNKKTRDVTLVCTPEHKWYDRNGNILRTYELQTGLDLLSWTNPNGDKINHLYQYQEEHENVDTYCFTEHKRNMGVFNGILTGQCSEITLFSDSENTFTCVLASENLRKFDERPEMLAFVGTVMLDCVASDFIEKAKEKGNMQRALKFTEEHRALGYGVMAFHTYLLDHSIVWGSLESKFTNIKMFSTIKSEATQATQWMAKVLGEPEMCKGYGVRNTHLLAVAPTKSTALIVGSVSEGINPQVGFVYTQSTPSGEVFRIDPSFLQLIKDKGIYTSEDDKATQDFLYDIISHKGSIQHRDEFTEHEKAVYRTAFEINPYDHLDLVSERQEYICQSQSCNVFLANTTAKEMSKLYLYAYLDKNILSLYYHYGLRDANIQTNVVCESCGG